MAKLPPFKYDQIFSKPVRLLIKESHEIFTRISRKNELNKTEVITISRRYRSIVHGCVENLIRDVTTDHSEQIKTFKELEVIWNLCEILLLDVNPQGALIIQLKNWIKMHFDDSNQETKEILKLLDTNSYKLEDGENSDLYWSLVTKLILRGEHRKVVQLLKSHYEYDRNNQIQLIVQMIDRMPLSNQWIAHEFQSKWNSWSEWCKRERETGQFDTNQPLLNIVRLFSQDLSVYDKFAHDCETWYQLMVAYLIYTDPCIKQTDLSELCRRSISIFKRNNPKYSKSSAEPDAFDEIIIAAFEYELMQVIAHCCSYLDDNWWFVTHFIDLLHCSNQLKIHEIIESDRLRETFLQDYASTLFDNEHLWTIGVAYLDHCPTNGAYFLEILLSRVPLSIDDELRAHKIISIAKKRGLTSLAKSINLLMARGWLCQTPELEHPNQIDIDRGVARKAPSVERKLPPPANLSNALYWAIKSTDTSITTYLSDQYLYYYCKTETFPEKSVFGSLVRTPMNNERLAFLAKYYEFKQFMNGPEDDLLLAGNLIKDLLASKIYPKFFCQKLLDDAKVLLKVQTHAIFKPDETLDLMKSIEDITKVGDMEEDRELRKNLVRNMARALISPVHVNEK